MEAKLKAEAEADGTPYVKNGSRDRFGMERQIANLLLPSS